MVAAENFKLNLHHIKRIKGYKSSLEINQYAKTGIFHFGFKTLQSKLRARKAKLLRSFKNIHLYLSSLLSCSVQIIFPLHSFPQTMNGHPRYPRIVE